MNADTVTVKEIKAVADRLGEIIDLHRPMDITMFRRTSQICRKCSDSTYPCRTVKLAMRALRSLTGVVA